jgi:hypothetical protein
MEVQGLIHQKAGETAGSHLKALLTDLHQIGEARGFELTLPTDKIFADFLDLQVARQNKALSNLELTCEINKIIDPKNEFEITPALELKLLKEALRKFGFEPKDQSIFEKIGDQDIVEIYSGEGVQIYRSWSFFKFCSYSLAELLIYDWNTLYERPASIVNSLFELAPLLFTPEATTMPYGLPDYVLVERYMDRNRVFNVKMKLASPLIEKNSGVTSAFISTSEIKHLEFGQATSTLSFI